MFNLQKQIEKMRDFVTFTKVETRKKGDYRRISVGSRKNKGESMKTILNRAAESPETHGRINGAPITITYVSACIEYLRGCRKSNHGPVPDMTDFSFKSYTNLFQYLIAGGVWAKVNNMLNEYCLLTGMDKRLWDEIVYWIQDRANGAPIKCGCTTNPKNRWPQYAYHSLKDVKDNNDTYKIVAISIGGFLQEKEFITKYATFRGSFFKSTKETRNKMSEIGIKIYGFSTTKGKKRYNEEEGIMRDSITAIGGDRCWDCDEFMDLYARYDPEIKDKK